MKPFYVERVLYISLYSKSNEWQVIKKYLLNNVSSIIDQKHVVCLEYHEMVLTSVSVTIS